MNNCADKLINLWYHIIFVFVVLALVGACSDDADGKKDGPVTLRSAGLEIGFGDKLQDVVVTRESDGKELLRWNTLGAVDKTAGDHPRVGIALRNATADIKMNFGSYHIQENAKTAWAGIERITSVAEDGSDLAVTTSTPEVSIRARKLATGAALTFKSTKHNRVSIAFKCRPGEHFIGLGGQSFDVDHRGQTVPLWVSEDGLGKYPDNKHRADWAVRGKRHNTHTPMPIMISSEGYAIALHTHAYTVFDLCDKHDDTVRIEVWDSKLDLHVFTGDNPAEIIDNLTADLGRPKRPAPFAFGLWLDALYGSKNVRRVAKKIRDEGVAAVAIWSEDWRGADKDGDGYTLHEDWNVDRDLYPDFEKVAEDLHALGIKWLTYNNTFVTESADIYHEATQSGYVITKKNGDPYLFTMHKFEPASLLDLTNPAAVKWAEAIYRKGLEQGADGFMADFCEWMPTDAVLHSKEDALLVHNRYPIDYQALNRKIFDELKKKDGVDRSWFVRSGWIGSQPLVDVVWAGDQQTDWSVGDGMRSVIPMGLGLGVTGFPYFGHDIGGYADLFAEDATTKQLWFRWVTLGAFSPVMRTHHGRAAFANWNWETDDASTKHIARWSKVHMRLFPLLWRAATDATKTGMPIMRPMAIDHPDFEPGWTSTDQYILAGLYVSPVVDKDVKKRSVRLPPGHYFPLFGGAPVQSKAGEAFDAPADMAEIPVFAAAGQVLVLLPDTIQTLSDVYTKPIVGVKEVGDDRSVWLYRGGEGAFTEVGDKLSYTWSSPPDAIAKDIPTTATWNGKPVTAKAGAFDVVGSGKFEAAGAGTLQVKGGDAGRKLRIVIR